MYKKNSDAQFLESLFREYYSSIYKLVANRLYRNLGTQSDVDDLTQEVFIIAGKHIDELRNHPNQAGWLMRAANYVVKNHVRAKTRRNEQLFHSLDFHRSDESFDAVEFDATLQKVLKPEDYEILHAYYIAERPHDEICSKYHLSEAALRMRISRIKKNLGQFFIFLVTIILRQNI